MVKPKQSIPTLEEFRTQLRRHGLKATRQRLAVHQVMQELVHASADMVGEKLAEKGTPITTASIYNILSDLADYRIYSRRLSANGKMYFDIITSRHLHLYDRENHTYRDILDENFAALVKDQTRRHKFKGYTIEDFDIQLIARPTRKTKKI